jgi:hypothetical protein
LQITINRLMSVFLFLEFGYFEKFWAGQ